jgi:DNA-binding MarR family transcriptional regulator
LSKPTSNLEDHLGYWLRFVSNHVSHAFRLKVEAHGVTVAEWVVMRVLFDVGTVNPSEIANTIGLTRGAVSKLVERLVKKGLVTCRTEKKDRRYQRIALAESGRRLVPVLAGLADENDREFFSHLSDAERANLAAVLRDIVNRQGFKTVPVDWQP